MYHFIGIKGTGMSALAQILKQLGYEVQGSDKEIHLFTEKGLIENNIKILPFSANNIHNGMYIIKGNAFDETNVEVKKSMELGLKIYTYQEILSKLTGMFQTISVSGCHGKTTTTSMLAHVLDNIVGTNYLIGDGTGSASKENKFFCLESCEYKRHFLEYNPYYVIITNIELDHIDYYRDIDDVIDAFREFGNKAEKMVVACGDDPYTRFLNLSKPVFYYGISEDNDIIAKDVEYTKDETIFDVFVEGNYYGHFELPIFGKHMLLNALAVIGICYYERLDAKEVAKQLKTFEGARRRFSETFVNDTVIIDDYAHHPTEVKVTIKGAKQKYPDKKVVAVFQPHTFTRVEKFYEDYKEALSLADYAYVLPIYPSREKVEEHINTTSNMITDGTNIKLINMDDYKELLKYKDNVILFMSANDVLELEHDVINNLK